MGKRAQRTPKFLKEINKRAGAGKLTELPKVNIDSAPPVALKIVVARKMDSIFISFGSPQEFLGMTVENARGFAQAILRKCDELPILPDTPSVYEKKED